VFECKPLIVGGTAPSSGFIALYLAMQLCQKVAVYGMSLEASREGDEMRAPYHYFHGYVDSERQGLTLVHFSAQPEPFLTKDTP
jgi:hypothetical protein